MQYHVMKNILSTVTLIPCSCDSPLSHCLVQLNVVLSCALRTILSTMSPSAVIFTSSYPSPSLRNVSLSLPHTGCPVPGVIHHVTPLPVFVSLSHALQISLAFRWSSSKQLLLFIDAFIIVPSADSSADSFPLSIQHYTYKRDRVVKV